MAHFQFASILTTLLTLCQWQPWIFNSISTEASNGSTSVETDVHEILANITPLQAQLESWDVELKTTFGNSFLFVSKIDHLTAWLQTANK